MTLNDIFVSALSQLGRTHDSQTLDIWRAKFAGFANDAVMDIARAIGLHKSEEISVENGEINLDALSRDVVKVLSVTQDGRHVNYGTGSSTQAIAVNATGSVLIDYRYKPRNMENPTDVPEIPSSAHSLIPTYVVARERSSQDAAVQGGANVYYELYQAGLAALRKNRGEPDQYRIVNKW